MTIDDRIRDKNCNRIITEAAKYQHYMEKLINLDILQMKRYCPLIKVE